MYQLLCTDLRKDFSVVPVKRRRLQFSDTELLLTVVVLRSILARSAPILGHSSSCGPQQQELKEQVVCVCGHMHARAVVRGNLSKVNFFGPVGPGDQTQVGRTLQQVSHLHGLPGGYPEESFKANELS